MLLRRLPEANRLGEEEKESAPHEKLTKKGLPAESFSKIRHHLVFWVKKIWRFVLEAKEITPSGSAVLKVKRLFAARNRPPEIPHLAEEPREIPETPASEDDLLEAIKKEPKNLKLYDDLGKFYMHRGNFSDARDIYLYLTSHASGMAEYWSNLGFVSFKTQNYSGAAEAYKKSVALDSNQPNRYYNLAQSHKALGQKEEARAALNKALEIDPQNFKFLELKGRLDRS